MSGAPEEPFLLGHFKIWEVSFQAGGLTFPPYRPPRPAFLLELRSRDCRGSEKKSENTGMERVVCVCVSGSLCVSVSVSVSVSGSVCLCMRVLGRQLVSPPRTVPTQPRLEGAVCNEASPITSDWSFMDMCCVFTSHNVPLVAFRFPWPPDGLGLRVSQPPAELL